MEIRKKITELYQKIKNNYTYKSLVITLIIVLIMFLPLGLFLDHQHKKQLIRSKRKKVESKLKNYSIILSKVINDKFSLLKSLEVYTKENWNGKINESDFNRFAYGLYSSNSGIRNLIIAPEGINEYVYPIKNNEEAIGHNLIKDKRPNVRKAVKETINSKKPVASGPYELRQGGQGIILRKALYKNDEFWGLVTMALNMKPIYEYVKLTNENSSLNVAIKRKDKVFFGENNIFRNNPVKSILKFEGGKFTIAGIPDNGWNKSITSDLKLFRIILFSIILLLSFIVFRLSYRNFKVQSIVKEKTKDLKEMNLLLRKKEKIIKKEKNKIEYQAYHDQLTGLYNRRYFEKKIKNLNSKNQIPISIIIVDVNGLKIVNDSYGHQKGDELLIKTSKLLKNSIRQKDILVRQGGDEFAILLPRTNKNKAQKIVTRIKNKCQKTEKAEIPISLGLGIATKENEDQNIDEILKQADNRMYQNKLANSRSSKNKIVKSLLETLSTKSSETKEHALRMNKLANEFGKKLDLSNLELNQLSLLATLHDIGKATISKKILTKPNSLTEEEWNIMKDHPVTGFKITSSTEEFSPIAKKILHHHEHWDGSGYPERLKENEIPYLSRIISIIDAYDVMTNERPYSPAMMKKEALKEIKDCAGSQFDPELAMEFIDFMKNI